MRKGFTLVELLAVMILFPAAMLVLNGLFGTLFRDIPRASRVVQENTTLLNLLERIAEDVGEASGLPDSFGEDRADPNTLLIRHEDAMISYELRNGKVLRRNPADEDGAAVVWLLPNAGIEWRLWKKDGAGYAVEVRTHIGYELRKGKAKQKKMANSHIYFVGAL